MTHIVDLILLFGVVLAAYALADKFLSRYFNLDFSSGIEKFVFLEGLGLGTLAYLTFLLGICGLLYRWLFYCLFVIVLFITKDRICALLKDIRSWSPRFRTNSERILTALLFIFVLCGLLSALTPPTSMDEMMYHLTVPKLYFQHHSVYNIPEIMRASWVMTQEMLFTLGFVLKGDILAKLFHFLMAMLTTLAVYSFSRNYQSRGASLLAALTFYSTPMVLWLSTVANNDLGLTFFAFMTVYGAVKWLHEKQGGWLNLGAVFCGLALGTKYLGVLGFAAIMPMMLSSNSVYRRKGALRSIAAFSVIAFLVASVWYLRNYLYVQDPIFPFLNNIFHSRYWAREYWSMDLAQFGMGEGIINILLIPWNLTFNSIYFSRVGYIGPIFLMTIPLLLAEAMRSGIKSPMKYLLIYCGIFFVFWALSSQYLRYLIPIIPLLSILVAYAVYGLEPIFPGNIFKAILACIVMILFLNLPFFTPFWVNSQFLGRFCYTVSYADYAYEEGDRPFKLAREVVLGGISRDEYLSANEQTWNSYPIIKFINDELPANTKVLTIYDFLLYYYDREARSDYDYFPDIRTCMLDLFARPEKKYYSGMWTGSFLRELKLLHFTHLLVNLENLRLAGVDLLRDERFFEFARYHLKLIKFTREAVLYEIKYDNND